MTKDVHRLSFSLVTGAGGGQASFYILQGTLPSKDGALTSPPELRTTTA